MNQQMTAYQSGARAVHAMSNTTRAPCPQCDRGPRDRALAGTTEERGTDAMNAVQLDAGTVTR